MKIVRFVAVVLVAGLLMAQSLLRAAEAPAAGDDAAILPYMSDATFLVARLDVDRVDPKALDDYMHKAMNAVFAGAEMPKEQRARIEADGKQGIEKAKKWLASMSEAGGKK